MSKLDPAVQAALKDIPQAALKKIEANKESLGGMVNGWVITKVSEPTDLPRTRSAPSSRLSGGREPGARAVYPYTEVDSKGQKLTGANKYTLTFPKGATPPVNGFWSITMYMIEDGWWFVPNALNRFTVSRATIQSTIPMARSRFTSRTSRRARTSRPTGSRRRRRVHSDAADVLAQG